MPAWLVGLPLTQVALNPAPSLPSRPRTPALSYWLTPYIHTYIYIYICICVYIYIKKTTEESTMIITRRMQAPTNHSSPWRRPLSQPTVCSQLLIALLHLRTLAQQGPAAPPTGRHSTQPAPSLTQGSPWHRQTWRGPLGGLRGPGLSILSLLPLISWGDRGPKAVGAWVWGAEGTAMERCGEATQGGK